MVEVDNYNATTKREMEARERYWLETLGGTLNTYVPTRTQEEWRKDNREALSTREKNGERKIKNG